MNIATNKGGRRGDRGFYMGAAIGMTAIVFVGFARTYFLGAWFNAPALPWLLRVHGAVMSSWFVLFVLQSALIAAHRAAVHRRLGVAGAVLACLMVVLGIAVGWAAAAREVHANTHDAPFFLLLLGFNSINVLMFAGLVGAAIAWRRRGDVHKRLMLLATLSILAPAISRLPIHFTSDAEVLLLTYLCIVVAVAVDTFRHRRLHPAFGWVALPVIAILYLTFLAAQTHAWMQFAMRLVA